MLSLPSSVFLSQATVSYLQFMHCNSAKVAFLYLITGKVFYFLYDETIHGMQKCCNKLKETHHIIFFFILLWFILLKQNISQVDGNLVLVNSRKYSWKLVGFQYFEFEHYALTNALLMGKIINTHLRVAILRYNYFKNPQENTKKQ